MTSTLKSITAALLATLLITPSVQADNHFDLQAGGQPKPRVTKIQLGIVSPQAAVCPVAVPLKVWVFSNKPSTFPILLVADTGVVLGPYQVETVEGANGISMGIWDEMINFGSAVEMSYRIVTPNSDVASNWVPLTVDC